LNLTNSDEGQSVAEDFLTASIVLYVCIFILGILGNSMFCFIVCTSAGMKTVTNYFLLNLSLADISITLFCTLNQIILFSLGYFPFGQECCYVISLMQPASIYSGSYTLVAISIERYMSILHPLTPRLTTRHSKLVILVIWILSLVVCSPDMGLIQYKANITQGAQCFVSGDRWWNKYYHMFVLSTQYVIPVIIMAYCYAMMAITIWRNKDLVNAEVHSRAMVERKKQMLKSKQKLVKMLMVVVTLYTLSYFPMNIIWVIFEASGFLNLGAEEGYSHIFGYIHTVFLFIMLGHSCINPFIYFWTDARVRYGFLNLLGKIPCIRKCLPNDYQQMKRRRTENNYTISRHNSRLTQAGSRVFRKNGNVGGLGGGGGGEAEVNELEMVQIPRNNGYNRNGCKVSICSNLDPDLRMLMSEDPLMKQTLEMRQSQYRRAGAKISVGSMSTDITDVLGSEVDTTNGWSPVGSAPAGSFKRQRTRISTTTNPEDPSQYLVTMTIMEEPSDGDHEKITH